MDLILSRNKPSDKAGTVYIVIAAVIAVIGTIRQWSESIIGALMTGVAALVFSLNDRVEARKSRRHDKTE